MDSSLTYPPLYSAQSLHFAGKFFLPSSRRHQFSRRFRSSSTVEPQRTTEMLFAGSFFRSQLKPSHICRHSPGFSSLFSSLSASSAASIEADRVLRDGPRNNWTRQEIRDVYDSPVLDLLFHGVSASLSVCVM